MIERLPTPWGLVRSGVAPDHPKIKSVTRVYEKTAAHPRFRFFGNVAFGEHVSREELLEPLPRDRLRDRHAGRPAARHPRRRAPRLARGDRVRRLVQRPPRPHRPRGRPALGRARRRDRQRQRRDRRRPHARARARRARAHRHRRPRAGGARAQPRLGGRDRRSPRAGAGGLHQPRAARARRAGRRRRDRRPAPNSTARSPSTTPDAEENITSRRNVEILRSYAERPPAGHPKRIVLRFLLSPTALLPGADGRLGAVELARNELVADADGKLRAAPTGERETIPAGLVFRAIGYRGVPLPGVPFDDAPRRDPQRGRPRARRRRRRQRQRAGTRGRCVGRAGWRRALAGRARKLRAAGTRAETSARRAAGCRASTPSAGSSAGPRA